MHPQGIDRSVHKKHEKERQKKESDERLERELEEILKYDKVGRKTIKKSASGSPTDKSYTEISKKDYKTMKDASKAQKSMLELLAVEHVFRTKKDSINPADVQYLRKRAIAPVNEHIQSVLNSPHEKGGCEVMSPTAKTTNGGGSGITYPALVGLSDGNHTQVGESLVDKRKLTTSIS